MAIGSLFQISPFNTTPSPPPSGFYLLYTQTDNSLRMQDSSGNIYVFGATTAITQLTGDVSAVGPGSAIATINFVGGQTAANVASATAAYLAATNLNTPSTLILRDSSGNFSAGTITASLNGNASTATSAISFSGSLIGDVTGTQGATVVSYVDEYTAAAVGASVLATQGATPSNTASTLVERDASGNFSANAITSALIGNVTGNVSGTASNITATSNSTLTTLSALSLPTTQLTGTLQSAQFPALTGDITTTAGSLATILATVNSNVGTFGDASDIPVVTVNAKGLTTAISTVQVIAPAGTLSGPTLNSTVTGSSLTSLGYLTNLNVAGTVGIGTNFPGAPLDVEAILAATSGTEYGIKERVQISAPSNSSSLFQGFGNTIFTLLGNTSNYFIIKSAYHEADHNGTGTVQYMTGVGGATYCTQGGTIQNAYGAYLGVYTQNAGTINTGYGAYIDSPYSNYTGGTMGTWYGLYVNGNSPASTSYAIYSTGGTNYFSGLLNAAGGITTSAFTMATGAANGYVLTSNGSGIASWVAPATSGTVTSVSVVSANGFSGTVANATSTPAITLIGTLTGDITGTLTSTAFTATTNSTLTTLSALSLPYSQLTGAPAAGITQLTGDVTAGPGSGSQVTTLATVNTNVGSFGGASSVPQFTVNGKGLITAASAIAVVAPAGTLSGTTLNSTVVSSSLTSVGTLASLTVSGLITASGGVTGTVNYTPATSANWPVVPTTVAGALDDLATNILVGINTQTASYTLVLTDQNKLVTINSASATTLTIPPNSSVAFPIGAQVLLSQFGTANVTITAGAGVTLLSADGSYITRVQYSTAPMVQVSTNTWLLGGDLY